MSNREISITIDQASMGTAEAWERVDQFCDLLQEAIQNEYPDSTVTVESETSTFNGGRVMISGEWDGYASRGEAGVRDVITHWKEQIFCSGEWMSAGETSEELSPSTIDQIPGSARSVWGGFVWVVDGAEQRWSKRETREACEDVVLKACQYHGIDAAFA